MVRKLAVVLALAMGSASAVTGGAAVAGVEREVVVHSEAATLGGTLTLPEGAGPHPAALIVAASGPHGRDEARADGAHWRDLAERLAEAGVASLRLDARGVAASASEAIPEWEYVWTPEELAADSAAALELLLGRAEINAARVGLIGFSDGAARAGMVARERPEDVAFVALLSASGVSAGENLRAQQVQRLAAQTDDAERIAKLDALMTAAIREIVRAEDREATLHLTRRALEATGVPAEQSGAVAEQLVTNLGSRGVRSVLGLDPAPIYEAARQPTLALNGGADDRIVADEALPALLEALGAAKRQDMRLAVLGGLDHFLEGVAPVEPPVFDEEAAELLVRWIAAHAHE